MKKYLALFFAAVVLVGCSGYIKNENGSENIKQLDKEPVGCLYLYKIDSSVVVYKEDDAQRYLANSIANQPRPGNAYLVVKQNTKDKEGAIFGPDKIVSFSAKVYECPTPEFKK